MTSVSDSLLQVITMNDDRERRARRACARACVPFRRATDASAPAASSTSASRRNISFIVAEPRKGELRRLAARRYVLKRHQLARE